MTEITGQAETKTRYSQEQEAKELRKASLIVQRERKVIEQATKEGKSLVFLPENPIRELARKNGRVVLSATGYLDNPDKTKGYQGTPLAWMTTMDEKEWENYRQGNGYSPEEFFKTQVEEKIKSKGVALCLHGWGGSRLVAADWDIYHQDQVICSLSIYGSEGSYNKD